jgi:hypothetical protein
VFPGRCRLLDLLGMLAVGRREHDGIDIGIGKDRLEIVDQTDAFGSAEILRLGARAGMADNKANVVGVVLH